jgi:hypothetical protein
MTVHNNSAYLSAATGVIRHTADFSFILKHRHQFVSALGDAELYVPLSHILVQVRLSCLKHRCKYNDTFVAALEDAE